MKKFTECPSVLVMINPHIAAFAAHSCFDEVSAATLLFRRMP